jgi:hypothetical protein
MARAVAIALFALLAVSFAADVSAGEFFARSGFFALDSAG